MEDKKIWTAMAVVAAVTVGVFLKGAWGEAQKQAEEAANPRKPWTDKNRWE